MQDALGLARALSRDVLEAASDGVEELPYPAPQMQALSASGLFAMAVPRDFGGMELPYRDQARIFAILAEGCLTTAFVFSQHHVFCAMVTAAEDNALRKKLLPGLARAEIHGANGINFLHLPPERAPMRARKVEGGWRYSGTLPWTTAAAHSDLLAAGAVNEDGLQMVCAVPMRNTAGVAIDPPMRLAALTASETTSVHFDEVFVPDASVLLGPATEILKTHLGPTTFVATAVTLGHARRSIRLASATKAPAIAARVDALRQDLHVFERDFEEALEAQNRARVPPLRGRGNVLAMRAAYLALIACGGTGFREGGTSNRLYREAAFFSVWSVGGDVIPRTLENYFSA